MIKVERAYPRAWQASACLSGGMGRMKSEDCRVLIFEVGVMGALLEREVAL